MSEEASRELAFALFQTLAANTPNVRAGFQTALHLLVMLALQLKGADMPAVADLIQDLMAEFVQHVRDSVPLSAH